MGKLFFQTLLSDELVFEWAVDPWLCLRIVFLLMAECYLFFATPVRTFIPKKDYCGAHPRLHIFSQFNFAKMFSGGTFFNGPVIGTYCCSHWDQLTQMSVILCLTKSAIAWGFEKQTIFIFPAFEAKVPARLPLLFETFWSREGKESRWISDKTNSLAPAYIYLLNQHLADILDIMEKKNIIVFRPLLNSFSLY